MSTIAELTEKINTISTKKGWNAKVSDIKEVFSEKMLLVISEISEALEEFRNRRGLNEIYFKGGAAAYGLVVEEHYSEEHFHKDPSNNKPEGIPIELADAIIRILDFCAANEIDIEKAINLKLKYNETRSFRHGNKLA